MLSTSTKTIGIQMSEVLAIATSEICKNQVFQGCG